MFFFDNKNDHIFSSIFDHFYIPTCPNQFVHGTFRHRLRGQGAARVHGVGGPTTGGAAGLASCFETNKLVVLKLDVLLLLLFLRRFQPQK